LSCGVRADADQVGALVGQDTRRQLLDISDAASLNHSWEDVMMRYQIRSRGLLLSAVGFAAMRAVGMATVLAAALGAQPQDVQEGQRIWTDKAGCPQCHGWAGDGHVSGFESPAGLPLRKTQLTRDQIRMTIQCGRPATPMPHFDRFAYTDKRCYGVTAEDLGNRVPERAETTLQPWEIDAVADYVAAKLKGAGTVTRAECIAYFGNTQAECAKYPER
jgi:mono/diheme cytochrome c family protein